MTAFAVFLLGRVIPNPKQTITANTRSKSIPRVHLPPPYKTLKANIINAYNGICSAPTRALPTFKTSLAGLDGAGRNNGGGYNNKPNRDDSSPGRHPSSHLTFCSLLVARRRRMSQWDHRRQQPSSFGQLLKSIRISQVLLALNIVVFALQALYGPSVLAGGAKINSAIASGEYHRLVSPIFLHASVTHLMVNSFSLHSTGPSVESWFGKSRFLTLYIASGIAGNILSYLCTPTPSVGASGAIFGLVGASAVILARHHQILGPRARRGLNSLAYIVIMNFGMGMTPGSRIDNFGHLGGFLGGVAYAYLAGPRLIAKTGPYGRTFLRDEPILSIAVKQFKRNVQSLSTTITKLLSRP